MWNTPKPARLARIPALYATENVPTKDKIVHLHFFISGCDWYITEFDGEDTFFGFAILNNDTQNAEWGYCSFSELQSIRMSGFVQVDCELAKYFKPCKVSTVSRISSLTQCQ
jgi:hypothetical protein